MASQTSHYPLAALPGLEGGAALELSSDASWLHMFSFERLDAKLAWANYLPRQWTVSLSGQHPRLRPEPNFEGCS
jgi:hypothetical protein